MSKGTQLWPGPKMRDFFRAHIERETDLDDASVERLTEAFEKSVNRMLVWETPERRKAEASDDRRTEQNNPDASPVIATPPFNPYAFSAMVVLAKTGRDGLMKRLDAIENAENLRLLADAQHLAIGDALTSIEALRGAIVAAAEQRLADRKAAAS